MSDADFAAHGLANGLVDNRGFGVVLYEDDDQSCVIHDDADRLEEDISGAVILGPLSIWAAPACNSVSCGFTALAVGSYLVIQYGINLFQTNDDYLGIATVKSFVPAYTNANATHALLKQNNVRNGGIRLQAHVYGQ